MTSAEWILVVQLAVTHAPVEELTLSALLDAVGTASPSARAAEERAAAARFRVSPAGAWEDPFFAVGPDEIALGTVPAEMPGEEPMYPLPVVRVQLSQTIPFPGKLGARRRAAEALATAASDDVWTTTRSARLGALQLFLRALYLEHALAANTRLDDVLARIVASAEARYATGQSAHHDVLLGGLERATLRRDRLVLQRERDVVEARLLEVMGRLPGSAGLSLVDDGADRGPLPATFEEAVRGQPELAALVAREASAAARERGAELAALPDVVVQGMGMASLMADEPSNVGAMVGLSVPVFFPWKQSEAARAAARERSATRIDKDALLLRLRAEWVEAQRAHKSAVDAVMLYEREVLPGARAALDSSQAAYATNRALLIEVLAISRATVAAELELEAARIDVRVAEARLKNLLSAPAVMRLAPPAPTLFSTSMGAPMTGGGMSGASMQMGGAPAGIGEGMKMPKTTTMPDDAADGTRGMGGM